MQSLTSPFENVHIGGANASKWTHPCVQSASLMKMSVDTVDDKGVVCSSMSVEIPIDEVLLRSGSTDSANRFAFAPPLRLEDSSSKLNSGA